MISRRSSSASGSRGAGRLLMWSAAAAVTCATVGLSGVVAASATTATAKAAPTGQVATGQMGGGGRSYTPYPRLDSTNVITAFGVGAAGITPTASETFTGSARRGHVWVHDGTNWVDLTTAFPAGYYYDISVAPAPSAAFAAVGGVLTGATTTGTPAGLLRVTVRRADGAILRTDCSVSSTTGASTLPLTRSDCSTNATQL
ncbi:hypothetical protein AB0O28_25715 [Microbispora sp. NPDC088329]|uniref:hypothetical protein n=1 Tax=Microbispora sp. NPDC088329 TaxID=3154869 RepID=UPI00343E7824